MSSLQSCNFLFICKTLHFHKNKKRSVPEGWLWYVGVAWNDALYSPLTLKRFVSPQYHTSPTLPFFSIILSNYIYNTSHISKVWALLLKCTGTNIKLDKIPYFAIIPFFPISITFLKLTFNTSSPPSHLLTALSNLNT